MGIMNLFKKKDKPAETRPTVEDDTLELYANMQVEVTDAKGRLLFIARLRNLQSGSADLYQSSQDVGLISTDHPDPDAPPPAAAEPTDAAADKDASPKAEQPAPVEPQEEKEPEPLPVYIRGYCAIEKKAVYMEGSIVPDSKNVWRVENFTVTSTGNDRAFFRLDVDISASASVPGGGTCPCRLMNISVGGARIWSEHVYAEGDRFALTARLLEEQEPSILFCQVMRILNKGEEGCEYGCRFLGMNEAKQDQITQTMFAIQRRQRSAR